MAVFEMDWKEFLEEYADRWRLTPEQHEVFVARLAEENRKKSGAKVADELRISEAALKRHLNSIYEAAGKEFVSVASIKGRGKLNELRACLKEAWKERQAQSSEPDGAKEVGSSTTSLAVDDRGVAGEDSSDALPTPELKQVLKPGAPMPGVRLPENFVPRPDALDAVKTRLLAEGEQTLVVSAIAGLGGIGKSVLATAIVLDPEVQARFEDGILWKTLGQQPDLLSCLMDWIRELDKSRDTYSANTVEAASRYLGTLLAERRMLLVVDDVWNSPDAEWFRVGGPGCCVLVTTRTAVILGAERYPLDLMSLEESVELIRGELGDRWSTNMEEPAKEFAELLGYLPLALRLMAIQLKRGRSWEMLKRAFLQETKRLRSLKHPGVKLERLSEEERREYSLRSCFGLSLQWLEPELLERFIWLGVLPEDAVIQQRMAMTLWDVEDWEAEETLLSLYEGSLLTGAADDLEGELTYRLHDLLHVLAQELISQPQCMAVAQGSLEQLESLPGLGLTLVEAQTEFLGRYGVEAGQEWWERLPKDDGYLYQHLTWHLEQAELTGEIHRLMAVSDERGRNFWFEACDRIGQPATFVEDLVRGWRLSEDLYPRNKTTAIVLQCRYALQAATLNSLASNLSGQLIAALVKGNFWSVAQAWSYVEQIRDESEISNAIQELTPYFPPSWFQRAIEKASLIQDKYNRAETLLCLAQINDSHLPETLKLVQELKCEHEKAYATLRRAEIDETHFSPAEVDHAREIEEKYNLVVSRAARINKDFFNEALERARSLKDFHNDAVILSYLAELDSSLLSEALESARWIEHDFTRAHTLIRLANLDPAYTEEAQSSVNLISNRHSVIAAKLQAYLDYSQALETLERIQVIQDKASQSDFLVSLSKIDKDYFPQALEATKCVSEEIHRTHNLKALALAHHSKSLQISEVVNFIKNDTLRLEVIITLLEADGAYLKKVLKGIEGIQDKQTQVNFLIRLAHLDSNFASVALDSLRLLEDKESRAKALMRLVSADQSCFLEALETVQTVEDKWKRNNLLISLLKIDKKYLPQLSESILSSAQSGYEKAYFLIKIAHIDKSHFQKAVESCCDGGCREARDSLLLDIAIIENVTFFDLFKLVNLFDSESSKSDFLAYLARLKDANFSNLLTVVQSLQHESNRVEALKGLAKNVPSDYCSQIHEAINQIQNKPDRADALSSYLTRLNLEKLPRTNWQDYLHLLAHRTRADLMGDFVTLAPAIIHLGGEEALKGVVIAMEDVCRQWP